MLRASDFKDYVNQKRVFVGDKIDKFKLNNFLTRVNLKVIAEDDCLLFLDDSFFGLWGEGVLFTNNYLVYNLLGESGHIPLFNIYNIEFMGTDIAINNSIFLTFRKISLSIVFDIFREVFACLNRNDVFFVDINNHIGGSGIVRNLSLEDQVASFFLFVKANTNKEKIVELMGTSNFASKESIRNFILHDENLNQLSTALVRFSGLEGVNAEKTTKFFYMAFRYYSSFFYDELNHYKEHLARAEAREAERLRKEDVAKSITTAEAETAKKSTNFCTFINAFANKDEPTSDFTDAFLSVINGYSRKYRMNEMEYWLTFTAHLDFYFYTLALRKVLQQPSANQVFLAPFIFLLEGNKNRVQKISSLMNDEIINTSMTSIIVLMANQRTGNKVGNFNFLYEKISLCEKNIPEEEFMRSLNVVKEITERLVFEVLQPDIDRSSGIDKLF